MRSSAVPQWRGSAQPRTAHREPRTGAIPLIEFAAPWLLLAAPVAAAPALLHLVRWRKPRELGWGAMRFLAVVAAEQRRRLAVQDRLLLALRTLVLLAAVLVAAGPAWVERSQAGPVLERGGRVACVLAIDDSAGTGAAQGDAAVRELALAWLDTLQDGDEVTVLPLSRVNEPAVDPLVDLAAARAQIEAVRPSALSADHPGLLLAALDRLHAHLNPHAEVVLVAGGRAAGWRRDDVRWSELARRLAAPTHGSRDRPHLVVLEPPTSAVADLAITAIDPGLLRTAPRGRVPLRVTVAARGGRVAGAPLRIDLDGRTIEETLVAPTPDGASEVLVRLPPLDPGDHIVEARLIGADDAFPLSDRRATALVSEARVGILLAEAVPGRGLDGSLGAVAAALDPQDGADPLAPFAPRRIAASQLLDPARVEELLADTGAVILGGVPALDTGALAVLERFVAAGGGLLAIPGQAVDPAHWTRAWYRGGDGMLPGPCGLVRDHRPPIGAHIVPGSAHPLAELFASAGSAALAGLGVTRSLELPLPGSGAPPDAAAPLLLDDGTPLLLERRRGQGRTALLATALDGSWGALPWRAAMVPLLRTLVADLAARPTPPRTLAPGQRPAFPRADGVRLDGPTGELPLTTGTWDGRTALLGPVLAVPGAYTLLAADGRVLARRACAADPAAYDLSPTTPADAAAADILGVWRATSPTAAIALVAGGQRHGYEVWPWLVALAVAALLAEAWVCGRAARLEQEQDP